MQLLSFGFFLHFDVFVRALDHPRGGFTLPASESACSAPLSLPASERGVSRGTSAPAGEDTRLLGGLLAHVREAVFDRCELELAAEDVGKTVTLPKPDTRPPMPNLFAIALGLPCLAARPS